MEGDEESELPCEEEEGEEKEGWDGMDVER